MKILKSKSLKKPIVSIKILDDKRLAVVDNETNVRYFHQETLDMINGFKIGFTHPRYKSKIFDFSTDGEYFTTLTSDAKQAQLYKTKTKKIITKVDRHHGKVACVGIDPLNRYMFSCGDDGKTFAFDLKSGKLVFTLPAHIDTINDIAFSQNGNWLATASFDKSISVFSLLSMSATTKLRAHNAPVMNVCFFQKNKLISIDKSSVAIIWNLTEAKAIKRLQGIHDDVIKMTISSDEKFLFLGTVLGYVLVYDSHTYELLSPKYIKQTSSITAMAFDGRSNHLIVGTADGSLLFYDIYEGESLLKDLLIKKEFKAIEQATSKNPILAYTKVYELVVEVWDKTLVKAKEALERGEQNKAMLLFKNFKNIPSKNRIIQQVIRDYADFDKFRIYVEKAKLPLAYSLANQFPSYKDSKLYKEMQTNWKKAFLEAQKYVLDPKGSEKAKGILSAYRGISEKTKLIQELLTQGEVYKRFRVSIGQKEFKISFELLKQNPFLYELPEYDLLKNYSDSLYIQAQKSMQDGDTHGALKDLKILLDFPEFTSEVKSLLKDLDSKHKFFRAIEEDDMSKAYNMLAETQELQETQDGKKLQKKWNEDLETANKFAAYGDSNGVEASLLAYMKISSRYTTIGTIFAWCYMVQLENAIIEKKPQQAIENGIKNYMLHFGLQEQIENFFKNFKESYTNSKLTLNHLSQGSLNTWRPSMIVSSILD